MKENAETEMIMMGGKKLTNDNNNVGNKGKSPVER